MNTKSFASKASLLTALSLSLTACAGAEEDAMSQTREQAAKRSCKSPKNSVSLELGFLGRYETGAFDQGAAEIVAYDAKRHQVFVVNAFAARVDVLDIEQPGEPSLIASIDVANADPSRSLGSANSVAIHGDRLAVAIEADPKTDPGLVAVYDATTFALLGTAQVGALPDMLTFTGDGKRLLVANEGEPSADYTVDPEGSVSIVNLPCTFPAELTVQTVAFDTYNGQEADLQARGVRIFGPGASAAQDFEPEYIALSKDNRTAWVTLQENNAIAVVDFKTASVTDVRPLGFKDHAQGTAGLDASDRDNSLKIQAWPVSGMYLPDAIASYEVCGKEYLITANEGDTRDYDSFSEEVRVGSGSYVLDPSAFPNASILKQNDQLGRLKATSTLGDVDGDGDFDIIYSFGARSFSILDASTGRQVFDSGDTIEQILAAELPDHFNASHDDNGFDGRSDDKGPEPEAVTVGRIAGHSFAFIGLERIGGVMAFDVTSPEAPVFSGYVNSRDFSQDPESAAAGDLVPESIVFVEDKHSPTGDALLIVGNEVSGTTAIYQVRPIVGR